MEDVPLPVLVHWFGRVDESRSRTRLLIALDTHCHPQESASKTLVHLLYKAHESAQELAGQLLLSYLCAEHARNEIITIVGRKVATSAEYTWQDESKVKECPIY